MLLKKPSFYLAVAGVGVTATLVAHLNSQSPIKPPPIEPPSKPYAVSVAASGIIEALSENVAIGSRLAELLGLSIGSSITIISPHGRTTPFGTVPRIGASLTATELRQTIGAENQNHDRQNDQDLRKSESHVSTLQVAETSP